MTDDEWRPLRRWPEWMLRAVVAARGKRSMWAEAYFELINRSNDAADQCALDETTMGRDCVALDAVEGRN